MTQPASYSFTRYLSAKKSVDDRSINRFVWEQLARALPPANQDKPLQVLEVGAGIGTMIERMLEWDLLRYAQYTAIDNQVGNIQLAKERLADWARSQDMRLRKTANELTLSDSRRQVAVSLEAIDVFELIAREGTGKQWDLLIAHAFLDLVDVASMLPDLLNLLVPGGLCYFSLNFDGLTLLEPPVYAQFDEVVQDLYHRTMDERRVGGKHSGDSRTGRRLFRHLENSGAQVLAAGASDWVVHAHEGEYHDDEAYFLHFIVHTIEKALAAHPELDQERFQSWVAERHAQIERGELVYIAHQLDILGQTHG